MHDARRVRPWFVRGIEIIPLPVAWSGILLAGVLLGFNLAVDRTSRLWREPHPDAPLELLVFFPSPRRSPAPSPTRTEKVEAVREWPFDAPAVLRFVLYLLIPVAGWIGGALMERLLDAALG